MVPDSAFEKQEPDIVAPEPGFRPAQRFTEFLYARFSGIDRGWSPNDKLLFRQIAERCKVEIPALYRTFSSLDEMTFEDLPDRFVLKVNELAARKGIYLLRREGQDYFEMLRQMSMSINAIRTDARAAINRKKLKKPPIIFVEEMIEGTNPGSIPFDYKFYAFGSFIALIQQIDRNHNPAREAFFLPDFSPTPEGMIIFGSVAPGAHVVPANAEEMLDAARRLSSELRTPFVRVDLYTTGRTVYLGELTRAPGAPYYGRQFRFTPEFDGELGGYWKMRCKELEIPIPLIGGSPPCIRHERERREAEIDELASLKRELAAQADALTAAQDEIAALRSSISWRATKPLRKAMSRIRSIGRRRRSA